MRSIISRKVPVATAGRILFPQAPGIYRQVATQEVCNNKQQAQQVHDRQNMHTLTEQVNATDHSLTKYNDVHVDSLCDELEQTMGIILTKNYDGMAELMNKLDAANRRHVRRQGQVHQ